MEGKGRPTRGKGRREQAVMEGRRKVIGKLGVGGVEWLSGQIVAKVLPLGSFHRPEFSP